ncbi:zinc-dependent peptidase [Aliiroseovarius marinus]|uniref:M90 family metallopeptidase n=1 Tax=Aliiroseovarius marinus TaxID=2500159 RepID=UPI003D7EFAC1
MTYAIAALLLAVTALVARQISRHRRRSALLAAPLSAHQRGLLAQQVPLISSLPADLREKLEGKVQLFLHQISFLGCDGLEVTEEMELSIAGQACLLVVNTDDWYHNLRTILIYPGAFKSRQAVQHGFVVTEEESVRIGESWARGPVVLSWQATAHGARDSRDGHNVVFHEFAHQLDDLNGETDGLPRLRTGQDFADWKRDILDAYDRLVRQTDKGLRGTLDPYGAQSHEEFFAVAVEAFFERPHDLKAEEPALYGQLSRFFRLDPESWTRA